MIVISPGVKKYIPILMTFTMFQGYRYVKYKLQILFFYICPVKFKICMVVTGIKKSMHNTLCVPLVGI